MWFAVGISFFVKELGEKFCRQKGVKFRLDQISLFDNSLFLR